MKQISLPLPPRQRASGRIDFLASDSNRAALGWIERWPDWPAHTLILHGPPGSGKTHLTRLWQERSDAIVLAGPELTDQTPAGLAPRRAIAVDMADSASERALLHLYNWSKETGGNVLIVARQAPLRWAVALPDLASRLRAAPEVAIGTPDDALLSAVLVKHFADRQVRVEPSLIGFLLRRMERSLAAADAIAAALDDAALGRKGPISIPLARRVIAEAGLSPEARDPSA
ncbi:MAG: DNA replication protein [Alphaproteobacteria bacterium]|nr:DNA replication protein [Alphaproteobacteria bacterium]